METRAPIQSDSDTLQLNEENGDSSSNLTNNSNAQSVPISSQSVPGAEIPESDVTTQAVNESFIESQSDLSTSSSSADPKTAIEVTDTIQDQGPYNDSYNETTNSSASSV